MLSSTQLVKGWCHLQNKGSAESTKMPTSIIGKPGMLLKEWVQKTPFLAILPNSTTLSKHLLTLSLQWLQFKSQDLLTTLGEVGMECTRSPLTCGTWDLARTPLFTFLVTHVFSDSVQQPPLCHLHTELKASQTPDCQCVTSHRISQWQSQDSPDVSG